MLALGLLFVMLQKLLNAARAVIQKVAWTVICLVAVAKVHGAHAQNDFSNYKCKTLERKCWGNFGDGAEHIIMGFSKCKDTTLNGTEQKVLIDPDTFWHESSKHLWDNDAIFSLVVLQDGADDSCCSTHCGV